MTWRVTPVLGCHDVAASAAWWHDTLGFHLDPLNGMVCDPTGTAVYAILDRMGAGVHLQRRPAPKAAQDPVHYDAYFYVSTDIDELYASFVAKAVTMIFAPCDEEYGMRDFGIETPDGHRLNFGSPR
jgi:catechol 2,3-dioxygenase-like lactoylglutathione lyase family enzyme